MSDHQLLYLLFYSTPEDNLRLQQFIQVNFDCYLMRQFAPSEEELYTKDINDIVRPWHDVFIVNRRFEGWEPNYIHSQAIIKNCSVLNIADAPCLIFSQGDPTQKKPSKIAWNNNVWAEMVYDFSKFDPFFRIVLAWIREQSTEMIVEGEDVVFVLPGAAQYFN